MDENASRAVFLGVSVFVAIITLTLILNFYRTAKDYAAVANRYDISNEHNKYVSEVIGKEIINGSELRYLLNYYVESKEYEIAIYSPKDTNKEMIWLDINTKNYWDEDYQKKLDLYIRPNYNYSLEIEEVNNINKITAIFKY